MRDVLTYITISVILEIHVVFPYDSVCTIGYVLQEEPETQERDTQVPILANEACCKYKKQHQSSQQGSDREEGERDVNGGHVR